MAASEVDQELNQRLAELRRKHGDSVRFDEITAVVQGLIAAVQKKRAPRKTKIHAELEALAGFIHAARAEIAALRPHEVNSTFIPSATDELDAIVEATADATNEIMDATECIERALDGADDARAAEIQDLATRIYQACTFQDITGQRITKVVQALRHIENKITALVAAVGGESPPAPTPAPDSSAKAPSDQDLLNGPQLPDQANRQADIDALLASFE